MNFRTIQTLLITLLISSHLLQAQNPWKFIEEGEINSRSDDRKIIPQKYNTTKIDLSSLQEILDAAPNRYEPSPMDQEIILTLPMPDGTFQDFKIEKASVLHENLQRRFPNIQSYAGVGIDDPTARLRFDMTTRGFHAQILTGKTSTVYIDPYSRGNVLDYLVYYRKDYSEETDFECHSKAVSQNLTQNHSANQRIAGDCQLRQYRLALACTGEYYNYHGGTFSDVLSAMNTTMTRVNGIFENDLGVTMQIIPNNDLIMFTNGNNDPYNNNSADALLGQNQTVIDNNIGFANYDIGHVFSTGDGGVALLDAPCNTFKAGGVTGLDTPEGDPFDVGYVAHEMGHQFGAVHTQNNDCNRDNAIEPGSGSTIMSYAGICSPDVQNDSHDNFHAISIYEITNTIQNLTAGTCPNIINTSNNAPTASISETSYMIPISTPFVLTGSGSDIDGDALTYCWEQMNYEVAPMPPQSTSTVGPLFRAFPPTAQSNRYFPSLPDILDGTNTAEWEVLPSVSRDMKFRMTVRDNHATYGCTDEKDVKVTTNASAGPFKVTYPNTAVNWQVGNTETITWDVAGTDANGINCQKVDISLSLDGGQTFTQTLASGVENDGSHTISVPFNEFVATNMLRLMIKCSDNIFFDISDEDFVIEYVEPTFHLNTNLGFISTCSDDSPFFGVFPTPVQGFNSPVSFSVSGLPAGASVTFTNPSVTPPAGTALVINNLNTVASGIYTLNITATGGGTSSSMEVNLEVDNNVSQAPVLTSPVDGDNTQFVNPTLSWETVSNATSYTVELATDASFNNIIITRTGIIDPTTAITGLMDGTTYYWRAKGTNSCGNEPWSSIFSFSTYPCQNMTVDIVLDNYGEEVKWQISEVGNIYNIYLSGGPYDNDIAGQVISESICLSAGCYEFIIFDSGSDGLCCDEGNGSYTLSDSNMNTIASGANFQDKEATQFCIPEPSCTDGIQNGDETGIDCGGTYCSGCSLQDLYVDISATGNNDGSDWTNAFTDLQSALAIGSNSTIHIAEGTYKPTSGTSRGATFNLPSGSTILGGYPAGGGTRDFGANETKLSGNIDPLYIDGDSYHVITVKDVNGVTIDGISISDGNADNSNSFARARGGGLYVKGARVSMKNVTVKWNKADYGGGIFATLSPNVSMENCTFKNNKSYFNGSAIYHSNMTNMYIRSSKITNNRADSRATVEVNNSLYTLLENTLIANNSTSNSNALSLIATNRNQTCDIYNCTITGEEINKYLLNLQIGFNDILGVNVYNSIIAHQNPNFNKGVVTYQNGTLNFTTQNCYVSGNSIQGNGTNNLFTAVDGALSLNSDYSLPSNSLAIDAGNNSFASQLMGDIDGNNRTVGSSVDIGAFEFQSAGARKAQDDENISFQQSPIQVYPNPTRSSIYIKSELEQLDISIFNLLGERMIQTQEREIDMSKFPTGIYMVIAYKNGQILTQQKVMKQ